MQNHASYIFVNHQLNLRFQKDRLIHPIKLQLLQDIDRVDVSKDISFIFLLRFAFLNNLF